MVSPEGTGTQPDRPKSGRGILLAVAALVIVAGFAVLGALSPAEELAVETTTTTTATTTTLIEAPIDLDNFDVGQIVTGEPLELTRATEVGDGYPLALVQHDGAYYLFTTDTPPWPVQEGPLMAWRSDDGSSWSELGEVIGPEHRVGSVTSTGGELVALASAAADGILTVLRSDDGVSWSSDVIDVGRPSLVSSFGTAIAANDGVTVVAVSAGVEVHRLITEALETEDFPSQWGWGLETGAPGEEAIVIYGPLGIRLADIPLGELDLTDEERQLVVEDQTRGLPSDTTIWVKEESSVWKGSSIEGLNGVDAIHAEPTGGFTILGWGTSRPVTLTSKDGWDWEPTEPRIDGPWRVHEWGNRLAGPDDMSLPELLVSEDGVNWEPSGLADHFPVAINWNTYISGASSGGVAMVVAGSSQRSQFETPDPVIVTTDLEHTVTLDFMSGTIRLDTSDPGHVWNMWASESPEGVTVDLSTETVIFGDVETGQSFGAVTFDELQHAEEDFYRSQYRGDEHRALVFTTDAETWTIQDLSDSIGTDAAISSVTVGSDTLVAVVFPAGPLYSPLPDSSFEIWTAPLP